MSEWNNFGSLTIEGWGWFLDKHKYKTKTPPILQCEHAIAKDEHVEYPGVISIEVGDGKVGHVCLKCVENAIRNQSDKEGYPRCFGCGKYYGDCENFCECGRPYRFGDGLYKHF